MRKKEKEKGQKRKMSEEASDHETPLNEPGSSSKPEQEEVEGALIPEVDTISPLTTSLRERGAGAVDGLPERFPKEFMSSCKL